MRGGLTSRRYQDLPPVDAAAKLRGEELAKLVKAFQRRPRPRRGPASGARGRLGEQARRLEAFIEIAGGQTQYPGDGELEVGHHGIGAGDDRTESQGLPAVIKRDRYRPIRCGQGERPGPWAGAHQPPAREFSHHRLNGGRADAVAALEFPCGRDSRACGHAADQPLKLLRQPTSATIHRGKG